MMMNLYGFNSDIDYMNEINRLKSKLVECQRQRDGLREALSEILDCPYTIDDATVPRAGIDAAPEQIVGILSVSIMRIRKGQAALASVQDDR